ncbi:MAG: hypothetical protein R3C17_21305 [Planctomycetaceae bacterium]
MDSQTEFTAESNDWPTGLATYTRKRPGSSRRSVMATIAMRFVGLTLEYTECLTLLAAL